MTQGSQQEALSSSGAVQHGSVAPVLVESSFDESCWSGNDGVRRPWWKSRSWNIFENATSKVLRMCRLGGGDVNGAAGCLGEAVE